MDISSANAPEFVNQRTGQPVILERPFWNAEDFLEPIVCQNFYFDGIDYQVSASAVLMDFEALPTNAPFQSRVLLNPSPGARSAPFRWSLENGIYTGPTALGQTPWVETGNFEPNVAGSDIDLIGVRVWTSDFGFTRCITTNPLEAFLPTGIPEDVVSPFNGECIDTPPTGDGWGWDGTQSCRIGAVAEMECFDSPPVGDGWGWNGIESCRI